MTIIYKDNLHKSSIILSRTIVYIFFVDEYFNNLWMIYYNI